MSNHRGCDWPQPPATSQQSSMTFFLHSKQQTTIQTVQMKANIPSKRTSSCQNERKLVRCCTAGLLACLLAGLLAGWLACLLACVRACLLACLLCRFNTLPTSLRVQYRPTYVCTTSQAPCTAHSLLTLRLASGRKHTTKKAVSCVLHGKLGALLSEIQWAVTHQDTTRHKAGVDVIRTCVRGKKVARRNSCQQCTVQGRGRLQVLPQAAANERATSPHLKRRLRRMPNMICVKTDDSTCRKF